jgi:hypothetical protein
VKGVLLNMPEEMVSEEAGDAVRERTMPVEDSGSA